MTDQCILADQLDKQLLSNSSLNEQPILPIAEPELGTANTSGSFSVYYDPLMSLNIAVQQQLAKDEEEERLEKERLRGETTTTSVKTPAEKKKKKKIIYKGGIAYFLLT